MARQAGFEGITSHEWVGYTNSLEAFAKLVAEKEREACAKAMQPMLRDMISRGQAAEIIRARAQADGGEA